MKKIISAIICLTLIFGLTSLKTNKSDNRKYFKNLAINIEKDYSKNNNSPKDFPKEFPEEFPYDKLAIDLKENSETKTADNTNHQENEKEEWVKLNGNRLLFSQQTHVSSVQVFDFSMRLLAVVHVNSSNEVQLPASLRGCMLVKIDAKNRPSEVKKWCNF